MRKSIEITVFILAIVTTAICPAKAQDMTDAQKQKALDTVTRFCDLLSQFSSGKGQYLGNDELIFQLCSSPKISAYDDIVENKEDILATYLINITHDYSNDLPMTFSKPVIESVFGLPEFGFYYDGFLPKPEIIGYKDTYIIISLTQTIPSLNKSTNRKVIYSCNENRIISFSNTDSPFLSYQKGLIAFSNKDYETMILYMEKTLKVRRFDNRQSCYILAAIGCSLLKDMDRIILYCSRISNKMLSNCYIGMAYIEKDDFPNGLKYLEKSAQLGNENVYHVLGVLYSNPSWGCLNIPRAKDFFMKAIDSKDVCVKAMGAYFYSIIALNGPQEIRLDTRKVIEYLRIAGDNEYVMAYLPLAILYEESGDVSESAVWALSAARNNNHVAMAMLGKYYLSSSQKETVNKGIELLKQSLEYDSIDKELEFLGSQTGLEPKFPKSNDDVKQLLQKYNQ